MSECCWVSQVYVQLATIPTSNTYSTLQQLTLITYGWLLYQNKPQISPYFHTCIKKDLLNKNKISPYAHVSRFSFTNDSITICCNKISQFTHIGYQITAKKLTTKQTHICPPTRNRRSILCVKDPAPSAFSISQARCMAPSAIYSVRQNSF